MSRFVCTILNRIYNFIILIGESRTVCVYIRWMTSVSKKIPYKYQSVCRAIIDTPNDGKLIEIVYERYAKNSVFWRQRYEREFGLFHENDMKLIETFSGTHTCPEMELYTNMYAAWMEMFNNIVCKYKTNKGVLYRNIVSQFVFDTTNPPGQIAYRYAFLLNYCNIDVACFHSTMRSYFLSHIERVYRSRMKTELFHISYKTGAVSSQNDLRSEFTQTPSHTSSLAHANTMEHVRAARLKRFDKTT